MEGTALFAGGCCGGIAISVIVGAIWFYRTFKDVWG